MKVSIRSICGPLCAAVAVVTLGAAIAWGYPSVFPTGTTIYDPAKAYNCFVLFGGPDGKTHLIDMDGNEVHRWERSGFPAEMLDPALTRDKGHLLVQMGNAPGPFGGIFTNRSIGELDWDGKTVWEWGEKAPGGIARQNHDWNRLANGNTLVITTVDRVIPAIGDKPVADQVIREITPDGKIIWNWTAGDHLAEFGITAEGMELVRKIYGAGAKGSGFLVINDMQPLGPNKWFDAGDQRFNPENLMIDSREASFMAIIERKTGKIVWRLGPDYTEGTQATSGTATVSAAVVRPVLENKVPRPMDQTSGQHDAHMIAKGLPGAGNVLVFDNEGASGFPPTRMPVQLGSRVLEIDPVKKEIVWQYSSMDSNSPVWNFFSSFISSARRLPNGNTLIDEGMNGRLFQVTPKGEIVWEYVNPYFARQTMSNDRLVNTNWVYRAQPIPYNWVPSNVPHAERSISPVDLSVYRVPGSPR